MAAPLDGIRVVEAANWLAAPSASALLADLGADVIKIEQPAGDAWRHALMRGQQPGYDPDTGIDAPYELDNRGKRGIALALDQPAAADAARRLIADADVFITNLTAPRLQRYRLEMDDLREINDRFVYVVLTGYGTRGEDAHKTAFDYSAFWARSGIMSLIGEPDGPPMPCRPGQGDHATALNLLSGTLAALRLRDLTGEGQRVEVTLQRTGAWTIGADVSAALVHGRQPARIDRVRPGNPLFNSYRTADDRWLMLVMPTADRFWPMACGALGREEWIADSRYATLEDRAANTEALTREIAAAIQAEPLAIWTQRFDDAGLTWAPVAELPEVIDDPQLDAMNAWTTLESRNGPFRTLNTPFEIAGAGIGPKRPAPQTGEHTYEVLSEAGFGEDEIAQLAADGALG